MRVALVYRSFHLAGSLPRRTVEFARYLSARHEVHVFSMPARTCRSLAPQCTFHVVPTWALGDGRFSARELLSFARNAAVRVQREQFDLVHALAPSTWGADVLHVPGVARAEARLQGVPAWRYTAAAVRHPGDLVRRVLERKALTHPALRRIHVDAPSVRDALVEQYEIDSDKILVVTPSVNLDELRPPTSKEAARVAVGIDDPGVLLLLFCGNDFERKGLDRSIEALARVRTDAVLLVIGGGQASPFQRLAAEHGVDSRVRFLGARDDTWRIYQAADLVVLPTRSDVWGVTPIEAMACGVPPIVSAAAGSASVIRNGETGIVLDEPFDVDALRDAIEDLAADPARRHAIGRAGVAAAKAHAWSERAREIEDDLLAVAGR